MIELKTAITVVEVIAGVVAAILVGDFLGHRIGGLRLATILGYVMLAVVVIFVICAAIILS